VAIHEKRREILNTTLMAWIAGFSPFYRAIGMAASGRNPLRFLVRPWALCHEITNAAWHRPSRSGT
jgi:hypothetical protein